MSARCVDCRAELPTKVMCDDCKRWNKIVADLFRKPVQTEDDESAARAELHRRRTKTANSAVRIKRLR